MEPPFMTIEDPITATPPPRFAVFPVIRPPFIVNVLLFAIVTAPP